MKKICKIGMLAFVMLAVSTLVACGEGEKKQKEVLQHPLTESGKIEGMVTKINIGKDVVRKFEDMDKLDEYVKSRDFWGNFMDGKIYIIDIDKPGTLTIWTEGNLDTELNVLLAPKKTKNVVGWENPPYRSIEDDFGDDYNAKFFAKLEPSRVYVDVGLEDDYMYEKNDSITEEDIKAGKVFFTLKTAFVPD